MHVQDTRCEYGTVRIAPGNAKGDLSAPLVLRWEPYDGRERVEPTQEECAVVAAGLLGVGGP